MKQPQTFKRRLTNLILKITLVFLGLVSSSIVGLANQTLPSGLVIGDDSGLYASSEGEFFIDLPNILPGESFEKIITIRSLDVKEPFELGLLVEPISSKGTIDFNQYLTMSLSIDDQEIYFGPLLGKGDFDWKVQPLILGTTAYGTDRILKARFQLDSQLTAEAYEEASELIYRWTFIATKNQQTVPPLTSSEAIVTPIKPSGILPQTGEEIRDTIYKTLVGFVLIVVVVLLWRKRKTEHNNEE